MGAGALLPAVAILAGCTATPPPPAAGASPESAGAAPADSRRAVPDDARQHAVDRPEIRQGAAEAVAVGPERGDHHLGSVPLAAGASWLAVTCRSDGPRQQVTVAVEQLTSVGVTCEREEVTRFLTRLGLTDADAGQAQLTVRGPQGVEWYVSFQVPDTDAV
ncbi:hypothetical protein [Streptomyces spiramenti]|uniref:Lipoprotein n=1 Tax=Streptomyces spiramenti TaxID=2720606 RepID=A0ABX1APF4_9ACTN|nr:hypothetical protein [Streptomyces spiramenti]NJP66960.1 hypothetical protein [Streptomyces spiramenti]